MRPTGEQWRELARLAEEAHEASETFDLQVRLLAMDCDAPIRDALLDLLSKHCDPSFGFAAYMLTPQTEWMGGDSSDAKNHKVREPHVVPAPRQYL